MALAGRFFILIMALALVSGCQTATLPQKNGGLLFRPRAPGS